jgi:8-oxo-dGTP pyrophosphatase MutT (NUDIX family)
MMQRHFTVSAYPLKGKQVLLIYHPKLHKWLPPGGHMEENETPIECAKREVFEETGLEIEIIKQENIWINCWNASSFERPYLCLLENIPPHNSSPAHQHIDLIYLAKVIGGKELPDLLEKDLLRWFTLEETETLHPDDEIFVETKQIIKHILTNDNLKF